MAKFKVGQRVRLIAYEPGDPQQVPIGTEGTICRRNVLSGGQPCDWGVEFEGFGLRACNSPQLSPLTPPLADSWADEKVRQVTKPQHTEPTRSPVKTVA